MIQQDDELGDSITGFETITIDSPGNTATAIDLVLHIQLESKSNN